MNIPILFEDSDIVVIDKPAGITVNKADTTRNEITVQDWAEKKLKIESGKLKVNEESDFYNRGGIVHRLDKETSGILILAKNPEAFVDIQKQFKERTVKKVYIALAHGKISPEEGEIHVPVGRTPWNRKQFGIIPGGRESKTLYKVLQYYSSSEAGASLQLAPAKNNEILTYLELYPQSGRTHQIRVHLKYIGHPIFSDPLYAGRKTARNDRKILGRVFLHAAKISFTHPATSEVLSFESPLPFELGDFLKRLRSLR